MAENKNAEAESAFSSNSRDASSPTSVYVKWVALIVVLGALVGFFGIKPSLESYFDNNAKTTAQLAKNVDNQTTKKQLEAQAQNLPKMKQDVKDFSTSFPSDPAQQSMMDGLQKLASDNGVHITNITPSAPAIIGADGKPVPAAAAAAPAADGSTPAPKAAAPAGTLLGTIGLTIVVSGDNVNGFVKGLQESSRVFVINSLTYTDDGKSFKQVSLVTSAYISSPLPEPPTVVVSK